MALYIILYSYTPEGAKSIEESPKRIRENIQRAEEQGMKVHGVYSTLGIYDLVAIVEAPNDLVALGGLLQQNKTGTVHSTTLKAFTLDEFESIVSRLA
ncbi:MAG: GYD domain-containing protein [Nitrolancea sp.]